MTTPAVNTTATTTTTGTTTNTTTTSTTSTTATSPWISSPSASVTSFGSVTTPSAHISTVTLEEQISTARANVHADVNTVDEFDIEPEEPESCDKVDDEEDNDDCETHLQEFNDVMDNFKQKIKDKRDEPTFKI